MRHASLAISASAVGMDLWVQPEAIARCVSGELYTALALDELYAGAVRHPTPPVDIDSWDVDMFAVDEASGSHALLVIGEALFERYAFYDAPCSLDRPTARRFLLAMEAAYGANPYHSAVHGADVALSTHLFLSQFDLVERLSALERLAAIIGAMCHDFNQCANDPRTADGG